jgi:hypothetical protein
MEQFNNLYLPNLTVGEERALKDYKAASNTTSGHSACFDLNRDLRCALRIDEIHPSLRAIADNLDSVFTRCPRLTEDATVYRAIGIRAHLPLTEIGKRFRSLEYWSASHSEAAIQRHGAVLELSLPVDFPAYNMETLEGAGGSEAELLLPRGVLWEVESFSPIPSDQLSPFVRAQFENVARVILRAQVP